MNRIKVLPRSFVILLQRDRRRVQSVQQNILAQLPECEVWSATDGQSQEVDDFLNSGAVAIAPRYRSRLTRAKVAVTMSHLRLWKRIADENIDRSVILEDDTKLVDGFREKLAHVLSELPEDHHMIYLYVHPRQSRPDRPENRLPGTEYLMRHSYTYCRVAYALTAEGARRLIDYFHTLFDHGDIMINKAIENGVIRGCMSREILVHNLGQLTSLYNGEALPSNIWKLPTRLSLVRRRVRALYRGVRRELSGDPATRPSPKGHRGYRMPPAAKR